MGIKKKEQNQKESEEIESSHRTAESIRKSYFNSTFDPETKALMRGGSDALRDYFNNINKRRKLGNWHYPNTKFKPVLVIKV